MREFTQHRLPSLLTPASERPPDALRTQRLLTITAAIADAITPAQVYEAVVDQVATALRASSAGLWVLSPDGTTARFERCVGYSDEAQRHFDGHALDAKLRFPALDAMRYGLPIWIDTQEELLAQYPHLAQAVTKGRSYRIACLPVQIHGETLGSVGFTFDDQRTMDGEERAFLLLVARYTGQALARLRVLVEEQRSRARAEHAVERIAAVALENERLFRDNQEARLRTELLYRLAAAVINAEHEQDVFVAAFDAIERALGTDRAAILAYDADGVMRFRAHRRLSEGYRRAVEGHTPWSRDVRNPEPLLVPDVERDPSWAHFLWLFHNERIGSLGFIPLVAGGRLIGKFMVYYETPRVLADYEVELAKAIGNHVAAGINRFHSVAELQQTVRFNELFAGVLGHDLRNPLAAITTAAQLLHERADGERMTKPVGRILASSGRMSRMIDQLLDFTRVRVGAGFALDRRPLDLLAVLKQVIDEVEVANPSCRVTLEHAGDPRGSWDSDRLQQVFSNLVANAVQHGVREHGVQLRVDGTRPGELRVEVHNRGAIPGELLAKVFEPMTEGVRRQGAQGLGLGLYITSEILKAHGGRVEVSSNEIDGTTFTASLPRAVAREASAAP